MARTRRTGTGQGRTYANSPPAVPRFARDLLRAPPRPMANPFDATGIDTGDGIASPEPSPTNLGGWIAAPRPFAPRVSTDAPWRGPVRRRRLRSGSLASPDLTAPTRGVFADGEPLKVTHNLPSPVRGGRMWITFSKRAPWRALSASRGTVRRSRAGRARGELPPLRQDDQTLRRALRHGGRRLPVGRAHRMRARGADPRLHPQVRHRGDVHRALRRTRPTGRGTAPRCGTRPRRARRGGTPSRRANGSWRCRRRSAPGRGRGSRAPSRASWWSGTASRPTWRSTRRTARGTRGTTTRMS